MKKLLIFITLVLLLVIGCDDRSGKKPTMDIDLGDSTLYNENNHNELEVNVKLSGSHSYISKTRIKVVVDESKLNFIGTGLDDTMLTDESGRVSGRFIALDGAIGASIVNFKLVDFPDVTENHLLTILDMPHLDSLVVLQSTILPGTSTGIKAYVSSDNADDSNLNVIYSLMGEGSLKDESFLTDDEGISYNTYFAPQNEQQNFVTVKAWLELSPERKKLVNIKCQRRN